MTAAIPQQISPSHDQLIRGGLHSSRVFPLRGFRVKAFPVHESGFSRIRNSPWLEIGNKRPTVSSLQAGGRSRLRVAAALIPGSSKDTCMQNKHTLFRPSKIESKADATTKIVKDISEAETAARHKKTARLRAAREERDASEAAQRAAAPKAKPRKKSVAKAPSKS
ncbi:hypothetical protein [Roseitranquillus sediminis]|uniref:hypothetical protein n=1 Tax=Roseitranquillus sediminis TaxID=2809051 RepID=UPI001D0CA4FB|nr:hypothetical protein [Roseitranquillus sediminis]MBM9594760.1 hypothetical protein [Roseitranquillus sediminis]